MSKNPEIIIGIDPGVSGAISVWTPELAELSIWDTNVLYEMVAGFNILSYEKYLQFLQKNCMADDVGLIVIEEPVVGFSLKGTKAVQSAAGSFVSLYYASRQFVGIHKVMTVRPHTWKKEIGVTSDKSTSVRKAIEYFPSYKDFFTTPRGKLLDGRAESAIIAWWGKNKRESQQ